MNHERARELLERQFTEGPLAALESQALRAHLRGCEPCRARYDRLAELERALPGDGQLARMLKRGAPRRAAPQHADDAGTPNRTRWMVMAAAAALLIGVAALALRPGTPEIGIKGGGGKVDSSVRLFARTDDEEPRPVTGAIKEGDGLLLSYTNPQDGPEHLAVMARDSSGRIFWLLPIWEDPRSTPETVAIERGVADKELPRVVYHSFRQGPVEVCAVFAEKARAIPAWDKVLSKSWPPAGQCQRIEVKR